MQIYLACDHAAFEAKVALKAALAAHHQVIDLGTHSLDSVHYPEYAFKLTENVLKASGSVGVVLCGSGIGVSIAANRSKGIRAALCRDAEDARLARSHNDANVVCLGARRNSIEELKLIVETFLSTTFEGGRHAIRTQMMDS